MSQVANDTALAAHRATFHLLRLTLYNEHMTFHVDYDLPDAAWDAFIERRPDGHVLQTSAWAAFKARFGWSTGRVAVLDSSQVVAGASVLFRRLPLNLVTLAYIPKGPAVDWDNAPLVSKLFEGLDRLCHARRAFAVKLEPDIEATLGELDRPSSLVLRPLSSRAARS